MTPPVLELRKTSRLYRQGRQVVRVFEDLSMSLEAGEAIALTGPSGAGKSSLLHIAGLLEAPSAGQVLIAGQPCTRLADARLSALRRRDIGFVFQFHHLLPEFTALENVAMPGMIAGYSRKAALALARDLLARFGLENRARHRPGELSGGEQQRAAIARALANRPRLLLADEPTGNLDFRIARDVFDELIARAREQNCAVLAATHNPELARRMDRVLRLSDGLLAQE